MKFHICRASDGFIYDEKPHKDAVLDNEITQFLSKKETSRNDKCWPINFNNLEDFVNFVEEVGEWGIIVEKGFPSFLEDNLDETTLEKLNGSIQIYDSYIE